MPDTDFDVVTDEAEAQRIRALGDRGRLIGPITAALLDGKVLHFRDRTKQSQVTGGGRTTMAKRGFRVRTRSDENGGFYAWTEKVADDDA